MWLIKFSPVLLLAVLFSAGILPAVPAGRARVAAVTEVARTQPPAALIDPKSDRERLQGRWRLVAEVPPRDKELGDLAVALGSVLEFAGDTVRHVDAAGELLGVPEGQPRFRLNERVSPQELDLVFRGEHVLPGVYALQPDTLLYCTVVNGMSRPTELRAARDGSVRLQVYRRVTGPHQKSAEAVRFSEEEQVARIVRSLRDLANAMGNYHGDIGVPQHAYFDEVTRLPSETGRLPSVAIFDRAGKPLLSWRVTLLPYLGEGELYKQFKLDEPWDSVNNKNLLSRMPKVFAHPTDKSGEQFLTHYRVFAGPARTPAGKSELFAPCFRFDPRFTLSLDTVTLADGPSKTILVVDAAEAVPWTKPDELLVDHDEADLPNLGSLPGQPYFVATFADWSVHLIRRPDEHNRPRRAYQTRLLRQLIGWKDGEAKDTSSLYVR